MARDDAQQRRTGRGALIPATEPVAQASVRGLR
jgi:hypothetical protein